MIDEPRMVRTIASVTIPAAHVGEIKEFIQHVMDEAIKRWIDGEANRLVKGDGIVGSVPVGLLPDAAQEGNRLKMRYMDQRSLLR